MSVAFNSFAEAVEAALADKEKKRLAMLKWLYPGLQVLCLPMCVWCVCGRERAQSRYLVQAFTQ